MKITVGHLLIVAGVGTYAVFGPLGKTFQPQINAARTFAADKLPYMEFLRPVSPKAVESPLVPVVPAPRASVPPAPVTSVNVEDKLPAGEAAAAAIPDLSPASEAAVEATSPAPEAPKERVAPRHHRRRRTARPAAASTPAAAPATAPAAGKRGKKDPLVGTYVALTLNSGNVVKGVLVERTATNYKVELPGMGPFDYPANTVKSVGPAE